MILSSPDFNAAVKASVRRAFGKLEICWTDPFIDSSIVVTANDNNRGSRLFQVADLNTTIPVKWFHLGGSCRLNGDSYIAPGTDTKARRTQVGWWGATRCNQDGTFNAPYPRVSLSFASRPVLSVFVAGDAAYNEFPVAFKIYLTRSNNVVEQFMVTDNDSITWSLDVSQYEYYDIIKIELEILRWNVGNRVVKIAEFYSSIVITYTGDDIFKINVLHEMELSNGTLPIGNISCGEIDISLQNITDMFFPGNLNSPIHALVKKNRRITAWIGFRLESGEVEYKKMGVFWSGDWDTPENGTAASTSGRDRMELLRKSDFASSEVYENNTLYQLAQIVCEDAVLKMPDMKYYISEELQSFTIPLAWFNKKSYMETIRDIVEACLGYAYIDRNDVLIIGGPSRVSPETIDTGNITELSDGGINETADNTINSL